MNKLISSIFKTLYINNNGNFMFSPASYIEAINNLSLCLKGENLAELLFALGIDEAQLLDYVIAYKNIVGRSLDDYNCLLSANEYSSALNPEVVKQIEDLGSDIKTFDQYNLGELANNINSIVNQKTHGKIQNLISRDQLGGSVSFVILNCVYFKKEWNYKFSRRYQPEVFHGNGFDALINFLHNQEAYAFYEDSELDIVELPYLDSDVCCYLLVPKNSLFDLMENLTKNYHKINEVKQEFNTQVDVTVPAFKIETSLNLEDATKIAGVSKIFEYNKDWKLFNFDKLLPEAVVKVDKIIQKAYIDFTKDGTEAAAATAIIGMISGYMAPINPPKIKYIRADKPFLYVLADRNYRDSPLFMGVIKQVT